MNLHLWQWIVMVLVVYLLNYLGIRSWVLRTNGDDVVDVFGTKCKSIYILVALNSGKSGDRRCGRLVAKFVRTERMPFLIEFVAGCLGWRHSMMGAGRSILVCGSSAGDAFQRCGWIPIPIRLPSVFRADGLFPSLYILHTLCSWWLLASQSSSCENVS